METDFDKRKEEFISGYGKLREEFQCDFMSLPTYLPVDNGEWRLIIQTQIMDLKQLATPSPFNV